MALANAINLPTYRFTSSGNIISGPFTTSIESEYSLTIIGNIVFMLLEEVGGQASNNLLMTFSAAIPAEFRPVEDFADCYIRVLNNTTDALGNVQINSTTGVITIGVAPGTAFSATGDCGIFSTTCTWTI